ncbi:MAG: AraC family transcriptional regulator [Lachnospiraceae bacterium]|nr:AraC family transcriptional regulator [Lachnospiraceae bacterium]
MFQIMRGGCAARHPYPFHLSRMHGIQNYVLLLIHTAARFQISGTEMTAMPGHAILIAPETPYCYYNLSGEYMDDWLHFEYTPDITDYQAANSSVLDSNITASHTDNNSPKQNNIPTDNITFSVFPPTNKLFPVRNMELYSSLIRQLLWEKSCAPPGYQVQNTDALFLVLFNHLRYDSAHPQPLLPPLPFEEKLREIRSKMEDSPQSEHSIAFYAQELKISESYFQHLYRKLFGISFQKDVIKLRVEHSMELLDHTDLTIEQLVELCGYHSEVHFYRQFKAVTGCTPAQYRHQCGQCKKPAQE